MHIANVNIELERNDCLIRSSERVTAVVYAG